MGVSSKLMHRLILKDVLRILLLEGYFRFRSLHWSGLNSSAGLLLLLLRRNQLPFESREYWGRHSGLEGKSLTGSWIFTRGSFPTRATSSLASSQLVFQLLGSIRFLKLMYACGALRLSICYYVRTGDTMCLLRIGNYVLWSLNFWLRII